MKHFEFGWETYDGLEIYAQGWEPDMQPDAAICLVHGIGEHSGRYKHVAEVLTKAGYAVVTFDLRGHGKSQYLFDGHYHELHNEPQNQEVFDLMLGWLKTR